MIVITGANGFIGRALLNKISQTPYQLPCIGIVRRLDSIISKSTKTTKIVEVPNYLSTDSLAGVLVDCEAVVHCAARVHVMQDKEFDPMAVYRELNVVGTINVARQAVKAGVRRFVFISSVKVNGEVTRHGHAFTAEDRPFPSDPYAVSKLEAEQRLSELAFETGIEVVIIRPPLVYGPGVKANFATMIRYVRIGAPLPLGAIYNKRSLVSQSNLVDFIFKCIKHPAAANQTFMVSDGDDVSTTELLKRLGLAMRCPVRLIGVPKNLLQIGAALVGKTSAMQRLCGSLQVDITKNREILSWTPPVTLDEGLRETFLA